MGGQKETEGINKSLIPSAFSYLFVEIKVTLFSFHKHSVSVFI
jgi:hypothetical protein